MPIPFGNFIENVATSDDGANASDKSISTPEDDPKLDWDELESAALHMFRRSAARAINQSGTAAQNDATRAAAEMLTALVALRAQRQAEEGGKVTLPRKVGP